VFSTSASRCKIWIGPEADIVHVADTYWNGIHPFIDYSTGGSIDGMITASEANLMATTDQTIIIPGHGRPVSNRAELKEFRDMLVTVRDNVAKLKRQGRSLDETLARMSNRSLPNSQWPRCEMTNRS
jgi:glyoxylase-like metal-dependent hydrolase (beta-lactamase superfamily II)